MSRASKSVPVSPLVCRRCGLPVEAGAAHYEVFEKMHYVCFHYEFEHRGDPDVECQAGGCPASGADLPPARIRISGVDFAQAGNAVAPAILALEACGYVVTQELDDFVVNAGDARFVADDPVALLGLVRLAELRRPWRTSDAELNDVISRFNL